MGSTQVNERAHHTHILTGANCSPTSCCCSFIHSCIRWLMDATQWQRNVPSFLILTYFSSNLVASFSAILYRYEPSCRDPAGDGSSHRIRKSVSRPAEWRAHQHDRPSPNARTHARTHLVVVLAVVPHQAHVLCHLLVLRVVPALQPRLFPCVENKHDGSDQPSICLLITCRQTGMASRTYLDGAQVHGLLDHDWVVRKPQRLPVHRLQERVCRRVCVCV